MKAVFVLLVVVAILGMAMAGTHHYTVEKKDSGDIFDLAANGIKAFGGAVHNVASGILG